MILNQNDIINLLKKRLDTVNIIIQDRNFINAITQISYITYSAIKSGHKVLLCGNGGSATDADHLAGELIGRFKNDRNPLPAIVLHQSIAALTAVANDYGYEEVFARQIKALGTPGDVLWAFSTSGKSKNILKALKIANDIGITTVAFTGQLGTSMAQLTNFSIVIPSDDTPIIQEMHKIVGHIICQLIEEMFINGAQRT